jgi:hypothetical protein
MLEIILNKYPELDFDKNNISFIKRQHRMNVSIPTQKDKEDIDKNSDKIEKIRREKESEEIQFRGIYEYNEEEVDSFHNRIVRTVKYLEIISKSLISHYVNLDLKEKQKIINLMYSAPNRILYALFKPCDEQYEKIIDEIMVFAVSIGSKKSREDIEEIINKSAVNICLTIYDNIAFFGANNETLQLLNKYDMQNSNYKIANLIMEENGGTTDNFVDKAIKLKEEKEDIFTINLIRLIVRKHYITQTVDYRVMSKIADKIFSQSSKKQVLISSLKKNSKKE